MGCLHISGSGFNPSVSEYDQEVLFGIESMIVIDSYFVCCYCVSSRANAQGT